MIPARKDVNASNKEQKPEDQTTANPQALQEAVRHTVQQHEQRQTAFITSAVKTPTSVVLSDCGAEGSTLQYRRVSIGPQLQTAVQIQGTSSVSENPVTVSPRCTVSSTQDLAHIIVTATSNSPLHAIELQNSIVNVSASTPSQQFQTLGNITNVNHRPTSAIVAQPQHLVFNSSGGMSDVYALRIAPTTMGSSANQQIMVLDSSTRFSTSSDIAKVHSYSLASASSLMSSNTSVQKIVIGGPGHQVRPAVKRQLITTARPSVLTVNSYDLLSYMSTVNKLLFNLMPCEGMISSIPSSPKSKRIKLEKSSVANRNLSKRKNLAHHLTKKLQLLKIKYYQQQTEYFFLKNGGNLVDYILWRKKIPNALLEYLKANRFDHQDDINVISDILLQSSLSTIANPKGLTSEGSSTPKSFPNSSQPQSSPRPTFSSHRLVNTSSPTKTNVRQPLSSHKHSSKHNSISSVYDSQIGSQEEIVERAKQEAYVMQRVGDLRKEGLWSLKRLPKVAEAPRIKAHYDYLLEEMTWLATDFAQERKWKKAAAKKCARMITKYFQEKEIKAEKAEKEEQMRLKKIASNIAREIKQFWNNIEKLADFKQQTWLEEKRKKVLDTHLNFIVDQTEKYSSWLTQGMNQSSRTSSPLPQSDEFEPSDSEEDEEDTIQKEEENVNLAEQSEEIKLLQLESEMTFEDFLDTLPPQMLTSHSHHGSDISKDTAESNERLESDDDDFCVSEEEDDDEQTILEQENAEENVDHEREILELEAENEMTIEELRKKYSAAYRRDFEMDTSEQLSSGNESNDSVEDMDNQIDQDQTLLKELASEETGDVSPSKEISDIAATAESFQPKGNTLSTTQVCTKVPFLLKHQLREYQHIGLDWMNAMYDKKLNGILADEMGLGKTIQTISVLAHLACEKGIWGQHLIVVPTSVMLNWEMELKKWCPAFKILTYYGTPKERKQKRVGWTKPNAFHICITSYKLVVQDHQSFRRKKWKYLILDEAQHIKNFKSQRWQMLLNFQSSHRLLLTGTPLQNNLMELWSLMHFLMPNVFQSHREFKEWFVNPFTGMIEGSHEYNDSLIKRLHKVLRPFLLRRLKSEVEKQLPKKYEHVVMCRLSKRQRYLYDDFMSQTKTKETLASGNFMSVINILMQLRKVCNHPNMFEERQTVSPFLMEGIVYPTASLAYKALDYDPFKQVSLLSLNLLLADLELSLTAFAAHRVKKFQVPPKLIVEIDNLPEPPPSCPAIKLKVNFCNSQASSNASPTVQRPPVQVPRPPIGVPGRPVGPQPQRYMVIPSQPRTVSPVTSSTTTAQAEQYTLQLVQPGAALASLAPLGGLTLQLQPGSPANNRVQCLPSLFGGISRVVQTASGAHFVITSISNSVATEQPTINAQPIVLAATGPRMASPSTISTASLLNRPANLRIPSPMNGHPATPVEGSVNQNHIQPAKTTVVHSLPKSTPKTATNLNAATDKSSLFYLESLIDAKVQQRKESLRTLAKINNRRCAACPIYGGDLIEAVTIVNSLSHPKAGSLWYGKGLVNALNAIACRNNPRLFWDYTSALSNIVKTPVERVVQLTDVINRFVFVVPAVSAPRVEIHIPHPPPWRVNAERLHMDRITEYLAPSCAFLHPILRNMKTQFPELRLIQYDCGKLQRLAHLLWELKSGHHRVLIFTQMTRMLDILEQFLNYHGHTYLRLDGNTKVEQRQALMERFNADKRIFCFILSTRSGGIGVNLTGADTVIFYDSDWNPTMDAQAQDRCHRIGQTRDVHIYRLISERTIEENILKKANQKRILGDLAIEGGNFTTAFFKTNTIHELFGGFEGKGDVKKANLQERTNEEMVEKPSHDPETFLKIQLEKALGMAEEESDLQAAQTASAEAMAELAEFDESIPLDNDSRDNEEKSPAEEEFDKLMEQLTPVERYALQFVESLQEPVSLEQLKLAEEEMEAQKKDWELGHLKALKEEEERRSGQREDSPPLFCSREASNQVFYSKVGQEEMPTWAPPTPPTNENDIYIDYQVAFWYEPSFMHEARLPPIFIKKEAKRQKMDPVVSATIRKQKVRKDDMVNVPRSLFDRPSAAILKMRREVKLQKVKGLMVSGNIPKPLFPGLKPPALTVNKQPMDYNDKPEWLVQEDWAILQVIQDLQGIPLNLTVLLPAHTPNWDFASEVVYTVCRNYRSPKSCRLRYENVIVPREEGKILYDTNPKKQKKTKGVYKTKNNRPMKTSQLYVQDNNAAFNKIANERFKLMMENAMKRKAAERPTFSQTSKNVKIASVLAENYINYDVPLTPMQIATHRAERIAREKQKNQPSAIVLTPALATAAPATQVAVAEQQRTIPAATANLISHQAVIASLAQAQQLQQVQLSKANLQPGTVASVSLTKSLPSGIMVNAGSAGTLANLTKALSTQGAAQNAAIAAALTNSSLRNQRATVTAVGTTATMTVQEMVAAATSQIRAVTTSTGNIATTSAVVSVSNLAAVQLAASQQLARTTPTTTTVPSVVNQLNTQVGTTQRSITQLSQLQALRQNALLRQRETALKQQHLKRLQTVQQQAGSVQPPGKVAIGTTAGTLTVAPGQRVPQQVTVKQSMGRSMTEAEVTQIMKRQQQKQAVNLTASQILAQAQLQQVQPQQVSISGGTATLVKTVSAPTTISIPVSAVNINVSVPQVKADQTKATITNQQLRQFQIQQQILNQARKGNKMTASLTQLAKVSSKGVPPSTAPISTVQIVPQMSTTQQVKGLPTAMTVQQIQQAMKQAIPQNMPVVVTATPSLSSIQQHTTVRGEPGVVSSVKTATLPSTTLTTSGVLKGTSALVVGQQQTTAILQQVAASSAGALTPQAVTLAVRAAQGQQQVQIQVQPTPSLMTPQAQVAMQSSQIRHQTVGAQNTTASTLLPATAVPQVDPATHVVMHAPCTSAPTLTVTAPTNAQVVQQAIQLARQQQAAAAAQQQKASPYTMRLRNPPK